MAATVNMGQGASIPITSSEYAVPAVYPMRYPEEYSNVGRHIHSLNKRSPIIGSLDLADLIEGDSITEGVNGNARGHEIRKRSPLPPWAPLVYGACKLGVKIGLPLGGVTSTVLTGGLGKAVLPVVIPAVGLAFGAGVCPKLSLAG